MKFIRKTIKFEKDKSENIFLQFDVKPKMTGVYEITNNNTNYIANRVRIVRGITSSRLSEVETYNPSNRYIVGVNGVTEVTSDMVKYTINEINYTTRLADNYTTFEYVNNYEVFDNSGNLTINEDLIGYMEKPVINRKINIDRNFVSGLDSILRILPLKSIAEIEDYGVNQFNINNQ